MVDNQKQWDNIEYSEGVDSIEYDVSDVQDDNFSDEEYENQEDFDEYEDEYDEDEDTQGKPINSIVLLLLLIILIVVGVFVFINKQKTSQGANNNVVQETVAPQLSNETTDMGDFFFDEAGGNSADMMSVNFDENGSTNVVTPSEQGDVVVTVTDTPSENLELNLNGEEENAIMVSYTRPVRLNPFKPTDEREKKEDELLITDLGFEIVEPPTVSVPDENLKNLLQTQISGILYDSKSPSAIVNLNGNDQFVKIGDNIGGYIIEGISPNQVQISYQNNTYVASVGELFTRGVLENRQAVVNLENKFAGRNRKE